MTAWHERQDMRHVGNGWYLLKERFPTLDAAQDAIVEYGLPESAEAGPDSFDEPTTYSVMFSAPKPPCGRARWDQDRCGRTCR